MKNLPSSAAEQLSRTIDGKLAGLVFKIAPQIDQSRMFEAILELLSNGCVGIFPEGDSHDRPNLLSLKPGVAIIALGLLARDPDCGLTSIPCGMNYFHAHKFAPAPSSNSAIPYRYTPIRLRRTDAVETTRSVMM